MRPVRREVSGGGVIVTTLTSGVESKRVRKLVEK
jgi:hypothetical protein